ISLHLQNRARIAGEFLQGHVELNVSLALKDGIQAVRVKLRGSTYISNGKSESSTERRRIEVLRADATLWTDGGPQTGILSLPFQFSLPVDLPPSFH
ncbi:hypothetical protein B0H14DRAFT_2300771, partial [Mycena olivaceomarginata]